MGNTKTSMALTPHALRRNRIILATCVVAIAPLAGVATGIFSKSRQSGPLLLAVDEMHVTRNQSSVNASAHSLPLQSGLFSTILNESVLKHEVAAAPRPMPLRSATLHANVGASIAEPVNATDRSDDQRDNGTRYYNGRPIRAVKTISMLVTAYSPDAQSCGESADGVTASGYSVWTNGMKLAAADTSVLPFGTMISVPGYDHGDVIPVLDRGGAIKGNRLDVLYPTHESALQWGSQHLNVTVWEYADGKPGDFEPRYGRNASVKN